jgi:putative ABC transport system permease protein
MTVAGETVQVAGEHVVANYFQVLGVEPHIGRFFIPAEDDPANPHFAAVISDRLWKRHFKGDPAIVGTEVRLARGDRPPQTFTIVGVARHGFTGVNDPWTPTDIWVTFAQAMGAEYRRYSAVPIARLQPGVTLARARAIVTTQGEQLKRTIRYRENAEYVVYPANTTRMPFDPSSSLIPARLAVAMIAVVAVVLLIGTANVAGLQTARAVARAGEIAIRRVVGAGPWRVARQLIVESVLLGVSGGVLGLILVYWLLQLFTRLTPERFAVEIAMDARVAVFSAMLCLGTGLLVGVAPGLQSRRTELLSNLPGNATGSSRAGRTRLSRWVLVPQLCLSLVLLFLAGTHLRALADLELADLGYRTDSAVVLNITRPDPVARDPRMRDPRAEEARAARSRAFYVQLLSRMQDVPGASAVALTSALPLRSMTGSGRSALSRDDYDAGAQGEIDTGMTAVSPGYFATLDIRFVQGRDFDERDTMASPRVAVISASLAERLWPGRSPLGRYTAARNNFAAAGEKIEWMEVVGVVRDVDPILPDAASVPIIYVPLGQQWLMTAGTLVARVRDNGREAVSRLKQAVSGADPTASVFRVRTMNEMIREILYPRRMAAGILLVGALVGLVLASIGLYGSLAYSLAQRRHEFGVRTALGASRADLIRMVLGEGWRLALMGGALAIPLCHIALRASARVTGTAPGPDVWTFVTVPFVFLSVILLAGYLPARRAGHADPVDALRSL